MKFILVNDNLSLVGGAERHFFCACSLISVACSWFIFVIFTEYSPPYPIDAITLLRPSPSVPFISVIALSRFVSLIFAGRFYSVLPS